MGSYLLNCTISQQVIPESTDIVLMPIRQQKDYESCKLSKNNLQTEEVANLNSFTGHNFLWELLGIKLSGKSTESYKIVLSENKENKIGLIIFYEELFNSSFNTEAGSNEYHDFEFNFKELVKKESINLFKLYNGNRYLSLDEKTIKSIKWKDLITVWEKLETLIHENRVFISDYKQRPCLIKFSACLQYVYEDVIKSCPKGYNLNKINSKIIKFDEELKNYKKYFKKSDPKNKNFLRDLFKNDNSETQSNYYNYISACCEKYNKDISKKSAESIKKELSFLFDFYQFQHGLNYLNLKVLPMYGGSQDYHNESGSLYLKIIQNAYNTINKIITKKYNN